MATSTTMAATVQLPGVCKKRKKYDVSTRPKTRGPYKKKASKVALTADGWLLVGTQVLKNFVGHGEFEGKVVAFVAASCSSGVDLWSVLYSDGDNEDMDLEELRYWAAYKKPLIDDLV